MLARSNRAEVRNPILSLPAFRQFAALDDETRGLLTRTLDDLADDAAARAEIAWRRHKGPMALYWRVVGVYSRHIARALRRAAR